jgi:hypothetical protein
VHYGLANEVVSKRDEVLMVVFKENSRRFKGKALCVVRPPAKVWINLPIDIAETSAISSGNKLYCFDKGIHITKISLQREKFYDTC